MSSVTTVNSPLIPSVELDKLNAIAETVLAQVKSLGCAAGAVNLHAQQGVSVNARLGEIETLEYHSDRGLSVTVYRDKARGTASTGGLRSDSVRDCVSRAADIARFTQADEFSGLPDKQDLATEFPDLGLWHQQDIAIDDVIARAKAVEAAGLDYDSRIVNSEGGSFSVSQGVSLLANSDGFSGGRWNTSYSQSCSYIGEDKKGMQRDYWYDAKHSMAELDAPKVTGETAAKRTLARLGSKPIKTASMPVIFSAEVAAGLIGHFVAAISGGNLYRNASFLTERLNSQVFPSSVSLHEQPLLVGAAASACFDAEGVATREREIVRKGMLDTYLLGSYAGRKLGMKTSGHAGGVHNLILKASGITSSNLLAEMGDGLLVTEVMGQGVNIVTGDYSRGAAGFLVRNGEIVHAVDEITIAASLEDMFMNLIGLGTDIENRGKIQTPSILIREMMVAGS
ncbi:MAG: metalloprotease PmbA [Xanthomonadales bacterium]|nr:metalloprotease PmbA [Xanthomonadales bacterium]